MASIFVLCCILVNQADAVLKGRKFVVMDNGSSTGQGGILLIHVSGVRSLFFHLLYCFACNGVC